MSRFLTTIAFLSIISFFRCEAKPVWISLHGMFIDVKGVRSAVYICHGDGQGCRILVDIPERPEPLETYPTTLTCSQIIDLEFDIPDERGGMHDVASDLICTASYHIDFTYVYEDGTRRDFIIENNLPPIVP
jgi:hypothetical protein